MALNEATDTAAPDELDPVGLTIFPPDAPYRTDPQAGLRISGKGMQIAVVARGKIEEGHEVVLLNCGGNREWMLLHEWHVMWEGRPTTIEVLPGDADPADLLGIDITRVPRIRER